MLGKDSHEVDQIIIILSSTLSIRSSFTGYHACKNIWTPVMNEKLAALMVPDNEEINTLFVLRKQMLLPAAYP